MHKLVVDTGWEATSPVLTMQCICCHKCTTSGHLDKEGQIGDGRGGHVPDGAGKDRRLLRHVPGVAVEGLRVHNGQDPQIRDADVHLSLQHCSRSDRQTC